jgi:hypothetical protein
MPPPWPRSRPRPRSCSSARSGPAVSRCGCAPALHAGSAGLGAGHRRHCVRRAAGRRPVGHETLVWGLAYLSTSNTATRSSHALPAAGSSDTAVTAPLSMITPGSHQRTTLLVTAVYELFGTHRRQCYPSFEASVSPLNRSQTPRPRVARENFPFSGSSAAFGRRRWSPGRSGPRSAAGGRPGGGAHQKAR